MLQGVRTILNGAEKMSFSNKVREEIGNTINDKDKRFACLYGILLFGRTLSREKICFQTESTTTADIFASLFRSVFHRDLRSRPHERRNGTVLSIFEITDRHLIDEVYSTYHLEAGIRTIDCNVMATNSLGVFTAGAFLACGSVNDPNKEYHLEFAVPEESLAGELMALLHDIGVTSKIVLRRGQYVVYIKGSESIEDTLTFIGAGQCTLELMNVKIYKDMRNKVNRIANCDNANIDKVVNAAMKQIDDILLIDRTLGLDAIDEDLREVAQLRLENSGMSLQEIGDNLSEPISRSGVNHRFKRLKKLADEIRSGGSDGAK